MIVGRSIQREQDGNQILHRWNSKVYYRFSEYKKKK